MGATTRNVIVVMTALTSLLAAAAWLTLTKVQTHARADVAKSLTTALESSEHAIHLVFHNQETAAELWAGNSDVLRMTKTLLAQARTADALISAPAQQELRTWLKPAVRTIGYRGFFIIANDDVNIAATRDANIGVESQLVGNGDFLARVRGGETLISLPQPSDVALVDVDGTLIVGLPTMFVAAPIRNDSQDVIAVLALRIEPDESFSPVFERGRFGDSGETYAFDASGLMISESRFNDQLHDMGLIPGKRHSDLSVEVRDPGVDLRDRGRSAALPGARPLTRMAASATAGESGMDLDGYRDYRGVPVVGAWLWDPELGFGIATEVDVSEAFAQLHGTRLAVLAFTLVSVAVLFVLAMVLSFGRRALLNAEQRIRATVENIIDGIITIDDRGVIQSVNPAVQRIFGYDDSELIGQNVRMLMPEPFRGGHDGYIANYRETGEAKIIGIGREVEGLRQSGATFPMHLSIAELWAGKQRLFVGVVRDITAQREAEQALHRSHEKLEQRVQERTAELQDSEERYRGLFDNAHDIIQSVDAEGRFVFVNQAWTEAMGYTLDNLDGINAFDLIAPESKAHCLETFKEVMAGKPQDNVPVTFVRKDGRRLVTEGNIAPQYSAGRFVATQGIFRDITERRLHEERERTARIEQERIAIELTQLIDTANAPIFGVDVSGRVNEWNQRTQSITGYGKDEAMGRDLVADFITDDYKASVKEVLDKALAGEETENFEFPLFTKSGARVDILLNATTRRNAEGEIIGVVGIGQDITERRQAQAQVIQASKLATLGEMATAVAHELNQPLSVIRMAAGNALRRLEKGSADNAYLVEKLTRVASQTERASAIIDHMRMFGRKADEKPSEIDPREAIRGALELMGEQLRLAQIEVTLELAEPCPGVLGHRVQLEQVFLNLLGNARDAIQDHSPGEPGEIRIGVRAGDDAIVTITVEDSGGGIPPGALDRVFEPFFTTKKMGKGTGLGLSVSYGIIHDMGGTIAVANTDTGARFVIVLPVAAPGASAAAKTEELDHA